MSQKWFNNIDLQQNELQNGVIQNLAADPTSGKAGQIYYNTVDKGYRYHNGSAWVSITAEAVKSIIAGDGLTSSGTDTITISLGTPSASGSGSNTYGSNSVTADSHAHQIKLPDATDSAKGVVQLAPDGDIISTDKAVTPKQLEAARKNAEVTVTAGNGLTGGGTGHSLSIAMGTPSTITQSTINQVMTNSHTHGLSFREVASPATSGNEISFIDTVSQGVDGGISATKKTVRSASTSQTGVVQLATQEEVDGGTDKKKAVTPETLRKGKSSGVASLDANGKVIASQLPDYLLGQVMYGGNASTVATTTTVSPSDSLKAKKNITATSISIANSATSAAANTYGWQDLEGVYFICQANGTFAEISFETGDWIISTGSKWEKIDNTDAVKSVNGQTGNVNITRVNEAGTADKVANTLKVQYDTTGTGTPLATNINYDGSTAATIILDPQFAVQSQDNTANIGIGTVNNAVHATSADKVANALTFLGSDAHKVASTGTFDGSNGKTINFWDEDFVYPAGAKSGIVMLRNTGVTAGTYNNVTVDAKGRVVSASNIKTSVVSEITGNGTQKEFNITHSLGKNVIVQVFLNGQQIGSDTADELVGVDVYTTSEKVKLVFATAPSTSQKFKVVISSGGNGVESLTPTAADDNKVAIADSTSATGWKFGKVGTNNLDKTSILNLVYPVGSIYMSANNVSPQTFLGGTWVAWGAGRVPVGVNSSDTDFNTAEKTGGEKTHRLSVDEMPRHDHSGTNSTVEMQTIHTRPTGGRLEHLGIRTYTVKYDVNEQTQEYMVAPAGGQTLDVENGTVINSQYGLCPNGSGVAHNNLQPYITCYMWKRTV